MADSFSDNWLILPFPSPSVGDEPIVAIRVNQDWRYSLLSAISDFEYDEAWTGGTSDNHEQNALKLASIIIKAQQDDATAELDVVLMLLEALPLIFGL
jgi:hypothetical protein